MQRVLFPLALLVIVGGALLLFSDDLFGPATPASPPPGISTGEASELVGEGVSGSPAGEATGMVSEDERQAALARVLALGLTDQLPPEGSAWVLGRVLGASENVDEPAEALAGAGWALRHVAEDGSRTTEAQATGATTATGHFLATVPLGRAIAMDVSTAGFAPRQIEIEPISGRTLHDVGDLTLARLLAVTVQVQTGVATLQEPVRPVEGVAFRILDGEENEVATGKTEADGTFAVPGLAPGEYRFMGSLPPFAAIDEKRSIARPGETVSFSIEKVGKVKVRARSEAGSALLGFSIAMDIQRDNYGWMLPYFTDAELADDEAWHVIEDVKEGDYDFYAVAPGFGLSTKTPVKVAAGETTEVVIDMTPGGRIVGQVVSRIGGQPIAGAVVSSDTDLIPSSLDAWKAEILAPMARAVKTDARGRFELPDLTPGKHRLVASHAEYASAFEQAVEVPAGGRSEEVKVELGSGGIIRGHVYGPDGGPVEGAQMMAIMIMDQKTSKKVPPMIQSGKDGSYEFDRLPPGPYLIFKMNSDPQPGEQASESKMKPLRDGKVVVVDFGEPGKGTTVSGVVTWSDGRSGDGLIVMLMAQATGGSIPDFLQSPTAADGSYTISGVEPGRYGVMIAPANRGSDFTQQGRLVVGEESRIQHDISLEGASLSGRLVSRAGGAALALGEVILLDATNNAFVGRLTTNQNGSFEWPYVSPGSYIVMATADGHAPYRSTQPVAVRSGENKQLGDIPLDPGGRIIGTVLDASGQGVEGARVQLVDPTTGRGLSTWALNTDSLGRFEIRSVPPGTYDLRATLGQITWTATAITVEAGSAPNVTLNAPQ